MVSKKIVSTGVIIAIVAICISLFSVYSMFNSQDVLHENVSISNQTILEEDNIGFSNIDSNIKNIQDPGWEEAKPILQHEIVDVKINGNSMEPMLKDGEIVQMIKNYYYNNSPKVGDLVLYNGTQRRSNLLKKVVAVSLDKAYFDEGILYVNDKQVVNSVGQEYKFTSKEIKLMSLYIRNETLNEGAYFILGDNVKNSLDSRQIGGVDNKDFIGKIILD